MTTETKKTKGEIKAQLKYDAKVREIATKLTNEEFELLRDIAPPDDAHVHEWPNCRMFKLSELKARFGDDLLTPHSQWFKRRTPLLDYPLPQSSLKGQGLIYVENAGSIYGSVNLTYDLTSKLIIARATARLQLLADQNKIIISYHGDIDGVNAMCFRFATDLSVAAQSKLPQWIHYCVPTPLGSDVLKYRMSLSKRDETMSFIINTKHISELPLEELQRLMVAIDYHMNRLDPKNA